MKRILSFLSLLLCLTLLSGCSNQVVMSDRLLIRGIGIDSIGERRYRASVHVMKTTEQEDAAELLQVEGESVLDALNNLTLQIGKTPLYSHNLIVIFGRSCAEQGLDYVLDFFQRHRESRPNVDVFLAENTAAEIMETKHNDRYILSQDIDDLADAAKLNGKVADIQVYQIINMNYRRGSPYMPVLLTDGEKLQIGGTAIFDGWRLKGFLTEDETRGLLFLTENLSGGDMTVDVGDLRLTVSLAQAKRSVETEISGGLPVFRISVSCEAHITSIDQAVIEDLDAKYYKLFNEELEQAIYKQINGVIRKAIFENGCDIFSFGRRLYQTQPEWWHQNGDNWKQLMLQSTYEVDVSVDVTRVEQEITPSLF